MKHNWIYKKLGEVVTIERGGSPRPIQDYITTAENGLNWIKIGDAVDGSKYITSTKEKIRPEGLKKTRFVHKGDFILSNSMSFGRPYILAIDGCIHDGWLVLHDENQVFDKSYLYYYLSSPSIYEEFKRLAVGGVVNNLNSDIVRKVKVAIPSLDEQQAIVRELDAINHLIDLQEKQLREYDRLAQSLFYSTFGDPISNPKGWEVKNWSDVLEIINGKNQSAVVNPNGKYLLCGSGGEMGRADDYLCEENSVIIGRKGNINRPLLMREKFWNVDTAFGLHPKKDVLLVDYLYQFCVSFDFENLNVAVTIPSLRKVDLLKIQIPVPPLALQQTFAAQIEAIEQQKALIRRSLDEIRTLLAARMQYYFE